MRSPAPIAELTPILVLPAEAIACSYQPLLTWCTNDRGRTGLPCGPQVIFPIVAPRRASSAMSSTNSGGPKLEYDCWFVYRPFSMISSA